MIDREQELIAAATEYLQLLEGPDLISIGDYVQRYDPALQAELAPYLELVLAASDLPPAVRLTADEQTMADRAARRARERLVQRLTPASVRTISQLRTDRQLTLGALARALNLPVDLLARIERGGVEVGTLPARLVARVAELLGYAEVEIRAALAAPTPAPTGVRLHAVDGTTVSREQVVSFAEALETSTATAEQRAEWR